MPLYRPPISPSRSLYVPPPPRPGIQIETQGRSPFALQRSGVQVENQVTVFRNKGGIQETQQGDYTEKAVTIVTLTKTEEVTITTVDVGLSQDQIVIDDSYLLEPAVQAQVAEAAAEIDDTFLLESVPMVDAQTAVESAPPITYTPPTAESGGGEYYAPAPEAPPEYVPEWASGSGVPLSEDYTYYASGTASAESDLYYYGEGGGDYVPAYDPTPAQDLSYYEAWS